MSLPWPPLRVSFPSPPLIVFDDADIDIAVEGAMLAKMRNLGEACTAANRFYVHKKVFDNFVSKFTNAMANLKTGNGLDPETDVGPLVNQSTKDKVAFFVKSATGESIAGLIALRRKGKLQIFDLYIVISFTASQCHVLVSDNFFSSRLKKQDGKA